MTLIPWGLLVLANEKIGLIGLTVQITGVILMLYMCKKDWYLRK